MFITVKEHDACGFKRAAPLLHRSKLGVAAAKFEVFDSLRAHP